MIRRLLLVFLGAAAVFLVPWTAYLAKTLPNRFDTGQWKLAWVGFDIGLLGCFAVAAVLGSRRHRAAVPMLAATAALLCCDAWFDVLLDWTSSDRFTSVAMALGAELPIAALLAWRARVLLVGGVRPRPLTVRDIELRADPGCQRLMATLGERGLTTADLAVELGEPVAAIRARLVELAANGYVRQSFGRWRQESMSTTLPEPDEFSGAQRDTVVEFVKAKYDNELRLLGWAAAHREEFGPWGRGSRASIRLTEAELAAFDAEYQELIARYSQRRREPGAGREMALRFYAFPNPSEHLLSEAA